MSPKPKLKAYFDDYEAHHKNRLNKLCHMVGVPIVVITTLGLLALIPVGFSPEALLRFDLAIALWVAGVLWWCSLDWRIALPCGLFVLGLYFVGRAMPVALLASLFISSWALLIVGHIVFEKNQPAFMKNMIHNMVAPIFVFSKAIGISG